MAALMISIKSRFAQRGAYDYHCSRSALHMIRFRLLRTFVFAVSLFPGLFAQTQQVDDSGEPNGRFWREMSHREKSVYLIGFSSGFTMASNMAGLKSPEAYLALQDAVPNGFSLLDYEKEMDALYSSTENLLINLRMAWLHCNTKLKGTWTKEALEQDLIRLRKSAATHYTSR